MSQVNGPYECDSIKDVIAGNSFHGESGSIDFYDANGRAINTATYSDTEQVICFTPNTMIATEQGMCPVQHLHPGTRILTRDNGMQELAWMGRKDLTHAQLFAAPQLSPVHIAAGSLGKGLPSVNMTVSPNHRFLILSAENRLLFDEAEVLVAAKHLVGRPGITQYQPTSVSYIHLMFPVHELILSDGCWTESFQPAAHALTAVEAAQRDELFTLFPELRQAAARDKYRAARRSLRAYESRVALAAIQRGSDKPNIHIY